MTLGNRCSLAGRLSISLTHNHISSIRFLVAHRLFTVVSTKSPILMWLFCNKVFNVYSFRFTRSYPFPSFNVKDLHTVDQGVKKHLLPEMAKDDWLVLIGHFLGVDHCGHTYGPDHQAMTDKLTEMNQVIRYYVQFEYLYQSWSAAASCYVILTEINFTCDGLTYL